MHTFSTPLAFHRFILFCSRIEEYRGISCFSDQRQRGHEVTRIGIPNFAPPLTALGCYTSPELRLPQLSHADPEQSRVPAHGLTNVPTDRRELEGEPPILHLAPQWCSWTSTSVLSTLWSTGQQAFSVKGHGINIFDFSSLMFSVSTIQLCPRILSIAVDNTEIHGLGCVPAGLLTSLAPSPTNLPLLHRASATQAPSFSFWNILSLFPPALGALHYLFPIVGSSVPTSAHAWFPLAIHLSVYHLPLRKVFITTNQPL